MRRNLVIALLLIPLCGLAQNAFYPGMAVTPGMEVSTSSSTNGGGGGAGTNTVFTWVTNQTLLTETDSDTGKGCKFTVGGTNIVVTELGCYLRTNATSANIGLYGGQCTNLLAFTTITNSSGNGGYTWGVVTNTFTMTNGASYYLSIIGSYIPTYSFDTTVAVRTNMATCDGAYYGIGTACGANNGSGYNQGPMNFKGYLSQ